MSDYDSELATRVSTLKRQVDISDFPLIDAVMARLRALSIASKALTATRTEIDRLLTLTSEQATEIVGKDKALAEANDAKGTAQAFQALLERQIFEAKAEVERQSVLLGKAERGLARIAAWHTHPNEVAAAVRDIPHLIDIARAVLSELKSGS